MRMSDHGLQFLKKFEGCRLTAYWDVKGYSIGYGHFGVNKGDTITQEQAVTLLVEDLKKYETAVNSLGYNLTQGQFDALVDFAYNCGIGNLKSLTNNGRRTLDIIRSKIPLYNKAGGVVNKCLVNRRAGEIVLFDSKINDVFFPAYTGEATTIIKALNEMNVDSSYSYRKEIAIENDITDYKGSAAQNHYMIELLKAGQLRKV